MSSGFYILKNCANQTSLLLVVFLLPSGSEGQGRLDDLQGPEQNEKMEEEEGPSVGGEANFPFPAATTNCRWSASTWSCLDLRGT